MSAATPPAATRRRSDFRTGEEEEEDAETNGERASEEHPEEQQEEEEEDDDDDDGATAADFDGLRASAADWDRRADELFSKGGHIDVHGAYLTDESVERLVDGVLRRNPERAAKFQSLVIGGNPLTEQGLAALACGLRESSPALQIETLGLDFSHALDTLAPLAEAGEGLGALVIISASHCPLLREFPRELCWLLPKLEMLFLNNNQEGGDDVFVLPADIVMLSGACQIVLEKNARVQVFLSGGNYQVRCVDLPASLVNGLETTVADIVDFAALKPDMVSRPGTMIKAATFDKMS